MCVFGESTNDTCTAEYMNDLLERALEIKEQCDLTGIYDCCKVLLATVELPNNGHIGSGPFVLYIEVVPL